MRIDAGADLRLQARDAASDGGAHVVTPAAFDLGGALLIVGKIATEAGQPVGCFEREGALVDARLLQLAAPRLEPLVERCEVLFLGERRLQAVVKLVCRDDVRRGKGDASDVELTRVDGAGGLESSL